LGVDQLSSCCSISSTSCRAIAADSQRADQLGAAGLAAVVHVWLLLVAPLVLELAPIVVERGG
jgi:hypothetical protein